VEGRTCFKRGFAWLEKLVSEGGSVKLRVEVTKESLEKGNNEFCTIQIRDGKTRLTAALLVGPQVPTITI